VLGSVLGLLVLEDVEVNSPDVEELVVEELTELVVEVEDSEVERVLEVLEVLLCVLESDVVVEVGETLGLVLDSVEEEEDVDETDDDEGTLLLELDSDSEELVRDDEAEVVELEATDEVELRDVVVELTTLEELLETNAPN